MSITLHISSRNLFILSLPMLPRRYYLSREKSFSKCKKLALEQVCFFWWNCLSFAEGRLSWIAGPSDTLKIFCWWKDYYFGCLDSRPMLCDFSCNHPFLTTLVSNLCVISNFCLNIFALRLKSSIVTRRKKEEDWVESYNRYRK